MSVSDQSGKIADKSAEIGNETLQNVKATAEQSARAAEQSYSATVEHMRDFSIKMIDLAQANTEAIFALSRELATAKSPSDLVQHWTSHARKQFEMLSQQTKELAALGQ